MPDTRADTPTRQERTNMRRLLTPTVIAAVLLGLVTAAWAAPGPGDPGTEATDFNLQEYPSGPFHTLTQHRGQVVLLFMIGYG